MIYSNSQSLFISILLADITTNKRFIWSAKVTIRNYVNTHLTVHEQKNVRIQISGELSFHRPLNNLSSNLLSAFKWFLILKDKFLIKSSNDFTIAKFSDTSCFIFFFFILNMTYIKYHLAKGEHVFTKNNIYNANYCHARNSVRP